MVKRFLAGSVATAVVSMAVFAQPGMGRGPNMGFGYQASSTGVDGVRSRIHATVEEWKVIGPLLQTVITCRQTTDYSLSNQQDDMNLPGMFGGFGGFGPGGFGADSFSDPGSFPGGLGGGGPGGPGFDGRGGFGPGGGPGGFGRGGLGGFGPGGWLGGGGTPTNAPGASGNAPDVNAPGGAGLSDMNADNAVALALAELKNALSAKNITAAEIQEKLAAVHDARQKARTDLETAKTRLRKLLTLKQEAVLTSLGYLD